jgi:hypothetical protein
MMEIIGKGLTTRAHETPLLFVHGGVTDGVAPEWPGGGSRWLLHIDGDMTVDSEIALATSHGAGQAVSLAVATFIAQCCSDSVQVRRGPDQQLKLAPHAGGYFAPSKCPSP